MNASERKQRIDKLHDFIDAQYPQHLERLIKELNACSASPNDAPGTPRTLDTSRVHVWILNEFVVPNNMPHHSNIIDRSNNVRCKYGHFKINESLYSVKSAQLNLSLDAQVPIGTRSSNFSLDIVPGLILKDAKRGGPMCEMFENASSHIHGFFAYDANIHFRMPCVVFSKFDSDDGGLEQKPIKRVTFVKQTQSGDLADLDMFTEWVKSFAALERSGRATVLLASSTIYFKLNQLAAQEATSGASNNEAFDRLLETLRQSRVYILFYRAGQVDEIESRIEDDFKRVWKHTLEFAGAEQLRNLNTRLSFVTAFFETLRGVYQCEKNTQIVQEMFNKLLVGKYSIEVNCFIQKHKQNMNSLMKAGPTLQKQSQQQQQQSVTESSDSGTSIDTTVGPTTSAMAGGSKTPAQNGFKQSSASSSSLSSASRSASTTANQNPGQLSELEVKEYVEWIDEMSRIGSLAIKHTFLHDMHMRITGQPTRDGLYMGSEKRWFDFVSKNRAHFTYAHSVGRLNENGYLLRRFDENIWRYFYFEQMVGHFGLRDANCLWSLALIEFPLQISHVAMVREPEKLSVTPSGAVHNSRARITVLFAFNANGDYIQPYFVFPKNLVSKDAIENPTDNNYHWSSNGSLTFRVFEKWLFEFYEPYLSKTYRHGGDKQTVQARDFVLLFNAKLALIDRKTMREIRGHNAEPNNRVRLQFFGISREDMLPYDSLFKKTVRNRSVDMMLDSWRKTVQKTTESTTGTASSKLRYENAQKFIHLFDDAFQNCIEECVMMDESDSQQKQQQQNEDDPHNMSSMCMNRLRERIIDAFEQLKLWPIDYDVYQEYMNHAQTILKGHEKTISVVSTTPLAVNSSNKMEVDEENHSDNEETDNNKSSEQDDLDKMIEKLVETNTSDESDEDETWVGEKRRGRGASESSKKARTRTKSAPKRALKDLDNIATASSSSSRRRATLTPNVLMKENVNKSASAKKIPAKIPKAAEMIRKSLEVLCRRIPRENSQTKSSSSMAKKPMTTPLTTRRSLEDEDDEEDNENVSENNESIEDILGRLDASTDASELTRASLMIYRIGMRKNL